MKMSIIKFSLFIFMGLFSFSAVAQTSTLQRLEAKITELEEVVIKQQATIDRLVRNKMVNLHSYVRREGNTIVFEGVNIRLVNGSGFTNTVNGTGNLIIGYDETSPSGQIESPAVCSNGRYDNAEECRQNNHTWAAAQKTGSHNLVIGSGHSYTQSGGVVFGTANVVNGANSTVLGGTQNVSSANAATVTGGQNNVSKADSATVLGGEANVASGKSSSISGGRENQAVAETSSISGGQGNQTDGVSSSVSGGENNIASAENASVTGGFTNHASGVRASVAGGIENVAAGEDSAISGGTKRRVNGKVDWIAGDLILPREK